jgi:hypothetical protein
MNTRPNLFLGILLTAVSLSVCLPGRAAVYEFTVKGQVIGAGWPNVNVGDPFVIRYAVDSQDLEPSPTIGLYRADDLVGDSDVGRGH